MGETPEIRLKRLHMRSIRRGIKEMDIVLTAFAETGLKRLGPEQLDLYEQLLEENDQDLLTWVTRQLPTPEKYREIVSLARQAAEDRGSPGSA